MFFIITKFLKYCSFINTCKHNQFTKLCSFTHQQPFILLLNTNIFCGCSPGLCVISTDTGGPVNNPDTGNASTVLAESYMYIVTCAWCWPVGMVVMLFLWTDRAQRKRYKLPTVYQQFSSTLMGHVKVEDMQCGQGWQNLTYDLNHVW